MSNRKRRKPYGRNRSTQADHRDPNACAGGITGPLARPVTYSDGTACTCTGCSISRMVLGLKPGEGILGPDGRPIASRPSAHIKGQSADLTIFDDVVTSFGSSWMDDLVKKQQQDLYTRMMGQSPFMPIPPLAPRTPPARTFSTTSTSLFRNGLGAYIQTNTPGKAGSVAPEIVRQDEPILAARWASLRTSHEKPGLHLYPLNHGLALELDSVATCTAYGGQNHEAPAWDCTCGFYAVPADRVGQHRGYDDHDYVQLQVELSGRVVEHEDGYRAQHQRILQMTVGSCPCGDPAIEAWICNGRLRSWSCGDHKVATIDGYDTDGGVALSFTLAQLSRGLGIPVVAP